MNFELNREFIDNIRQLIENKNNASISEILEELHPVDISELYNELTLEEAKYLYLLLDGQKAADVLIELEEDEREEFLKILPSQVIATQFIEKMDSDDAADVIGELEEEKKEEVLKHIKDIEQAGDIVDLLSYNEDTAGGLMAKELIKVNENWTVETCFKEIRRQAMDVDEVYNVYVIDNDEKLKGIISLKKLIVSRSNTIIRNLYEPDILSVSVDIPGEEVANIMDKYDVVALPVVDAIGRLVGRITIDDIVDFIREEAEKDYQMISGISEDVEASDKAWVLTRARLPWLLIGLLGGILVALVISRFEGDIKINPQMAFFIPLIGAMAGNVGIQSSSIIVQSIAANTLGLESTGHKLMKEFFVGLFNGLILASLIFLYNFLFSDSFVLTLTVSFSLLAVIIFAAIFGALIPLLLNKLKLDPALATGPFITTMNDIMGLIIYFLMGRVLYGYF
ncbi:MAG: magnesium transporter [Bacteroidales bacterium]|nr:magnesium transporter [Bacteroidales bacterium]